MLAKVAAQDEARDGREALEVNAQGTPGVAGTTSFDDAAHGGERIEPDGQLRRLKADHQLGACGQSLVGEDQHPLGRDIEGAVAHETPGVDAANDAPEAGHPAHLARGGWAAARCRRPA